MTLNKIFFYLLFSLILALMLTIKNTVNATTVYKWIDEDGQVHYGNRSKEKNAKEIEIKKRSVDTEKSSAPLDIEDHVSKQKRFLNAMDAENKSIADVKRKKREKEEKKLVRCNASRDQLKRAEGASALYDLDEKGNQILLNKKQYEQAMKQARARVKKWCN